MNKKSFLKVALLLVLSVFASQFLTAQPIGYATVDSMGQNGTTDGAGGPVVTVTNSSDLIDYMSRSGPYVIQVSGMISVPGGMHEVTSNKTVIGIGSNSGIRGGGLNVGLPIDNGTTSPPANAVHNVIIRNLIFEDAVDLDPDNFILVHADFDNNGIVDIVDALLIAQYYVGLIELRLSRNLL